MMNHTEPTDKDKKLWADFIEARKVSHAKRFAIYKETDDPMSLATNALEDWNDGLAMEAAQDYLLVFYRHDPKYARRIADAALKLAVEPDYHTLGMPLIGVLRRKSSKELMAAVKKQSTEIVQYAYDEDYLHNCNLLTTVLLRLDDRPALQELAKGLERIINKPDQTPEEIDDREFFQEFLDEINERLNPKTT